MNRWVTITTLILGISSMLPVTASAQTSRHQKIVFNTPRQWQRYYSSHVNGIQHMSAKGMYFERVSDDIDLRKYSGEQIAYASTCYITPKTRILVLPYGTFVWVKNTGEDLKKYGEPRLQIPTE